MDIPRREVVSSQREVPTRISLKALQVLLVLVSHHGKVVGREALLEWVWPDTLPTDDVLTQAITQLRKAFGDDRDAPKYLETIAKGGYRLLAPIQWQEATAQPVAAAPVLDNGSELAAATPSRQQRSRKPMIAVAALIAAALIVFAALQLAPRQRAGDKTAYSLAPTPAAQTVAPLMYETITSRPGQETNPNLSPDGSMVAYGDLPQGAEQSAIVVQTTAQAAPRAVTIPDQGESDMFPMWSHDGRQLAFVRFARDSCRLMVVAASGGEARKAGDCYGGMVGLFDWTPDDRGLLMGNTHESNETKSPLRLLNLSSGQWRALAYPIADGDTDVNPHYSPDGRWIVFRRNISLSDLWRMPAGGGPVQRLTYLRGDIRGWDWLPDGSGIIFALISSDVGLYRYRMSDGDIKKFDIDGNLTMIDIAAWSSSVVGEIDQSRSSVFRFKIDGAGKVLKSEQLFASSGGDLLPSQSPDGRALAFISDRSMQTQFWLGTIDRPESLHPVKGLTPVPRHSAVWSQDGSHLLMIGMSDNRQALFEVEVGSDVVKRLQVPAGSAVYAAYTQSPDRLLVGTDGGSGRLRLGLYDTSKPVWRRVASIDDVSLAKFDHERQRIYFTRGSHAGLWSADPQLGDVRVVNEHYPLPRRYREWAVTHDGIRLLDMTAHCGIAWRNLENSSDNLACLKAEGESSAASPGVDQQGRSVVVAIQTSNNIDIGWLVLPKVATAGRTPPGAKAAPGAQKP
ncbi:MAG: winged helix-turn-helix domain-containing protein [Luteimonas sp.]